MNSRSIGVFDSGIGGLTVYRELKKLMPEERVIYLGDTARLPYGSKSAETIIRFSENNARFLLSKEVKVIVVACNSSSSYAVPHLQSKMDIPVIGVIEPGAEAAVAAGPRRIGVIGTSATIRSRAYEKSILEKSSRMRILSRDCPLFVPLVEEGWMNHPVTKMVVKEYLQPLRDKGIEVLVLGCTHYPVLKKVIKEVLGNDIQLIDSAETTAAKVHSILRSLGWLATSGSENEDQFFVTDFPERFKKVGEYFLQKKINNVTEVSI
jgi:glutamate racemase